MSDILFIDLVELEQEFYDCLFYYYAYPIDEIQQNLKFSSGERIDILELTIKEKEQIKAGIFSNNFVLSDTYQLHQELLGNNSNSVTVTPDQLYILLEKLELLKFEFPQLTKQIQKKRYSEILQAYVDIDKNICSGLNLKIEKKTKRVDTPDEAIGFRRSPITLTGLRAIAADARLAVNPDQIRPASLLDTIAGAPPASSAS